jgi:tetratricopeptide (TPR) repeat protein
VPPSLTGRLWWSFYESDAHFENFILRSLAYVSQRSREEIEALPQVERESQLLAILDREPFLLVLDGFERMLIAYSRMDAARLDDDDLDQQSDQHNLRKIADPRLGAFLRKLIQVKQSRVLISTRLVPSDLQTATGQPLPGSDVYYLRGLEDEDALRLWAALSVSGSPDTLLPLFHTFENYPLLIRALAGEVARYRRAPGQFDQWRKANPRFDPFELPAVQVKSHVLLFALQGLDESAQRLLQTVAAFRMPAAYDTLAALRLFPTEQELDQVLTDLEDRGLLGWDRRANRYDLHPVVRGVVWDKLNEDHKQAIYERLSTHFEALPQASNVDRLDDLAPTIELYNALIGLKRYDEAFHIFYEHLSRPMQYRWSANRQRVELLEMLFPDGIDQLPHLSKLSSQAHALGHLARSLKLLGYPAAAVPLYERNVTLREHSRKSRVLYCVVFGQLSDVLRLIGRLYDAEVAARRAYINACDIQDRMWQGDSLKWLSAVWATRGLMDQAQDVLARAQAIFIDQNHKPLQGSVLVRQAQYALWLGAYDQAAEYAAQAFQIGQQINNEHDIMRATRLRGEAAIGLGDWDGAHQQLHTALRQARATTLVEEELPTLIGLARLSQQHGEPDKVRDYLNDVWAAAEHGPYPLFQVDALNLLAQVESDSGHHDAAVQAADRAYRMAWLDGYSYHWGVAAAKAHLTQLKAAVPDMPPVIEHDPMPEMD